MDGWTKDECIYGIMNGCMNVLTHKVDDCVIQYMSIQQYILPVCLMIRYLQYTY